MSVVSEVEQESEPDDEPLVEPLAAPIEGAPHKYLIAFAVVLAALMQVIDSSIVNVALPDMMGNLGTSLDEIAWVSTGYILASVIIIPLTGWLGEFFGRKRYFVGSIVIFTVASFLCGASHSLSALVFWRIIQGLGGGALMTVSQAVLPVQFGPAWPPTEPDWTPSLPSLVPCGVRQPRGRRRLSNRRRRQKNSPRPKLLPDHPYVRVGKMFLIPTVGRGNSFLCGCPRRRAFSGRYRGSALRPEEQEEQNENHQCAG